MFLLALDLCIIKQYIQIRSHKWAYSLTPKQPLLSKETATKAMSQMAGNLKKFHGSNLRVSSEAAFDISVNYE